MPLTASDLLTGLFRRFTKKGTPTPRNANRFRPMLESCEDRTVPSTVIVEAIADATEGGASGGVRYTRDGDISQPASIFVSYSPGTATPGSDFGFMGGQVNFPANVATVDVAINPVDDSISEPTETVVAAIMSGGGMTIGGTGTATVNLYDNDAQVVSVAAVQGASEGGVAGIFRFTRTGDLSGLLTANISVGGTATSGIDYTPIGTTVTFGAGEATADKTVAAVDDSVYDPAETVTVAVTSGTGYTGGAADEDGLLILDSVKVTFTLNSYPGAIRYAIPWASVDPDQASQSLTPAMFSLDIAGQDYAYGPANFTTVPALLFEHGDLVGVEFDLDLTGTGAPFVNISMADGVVTGTDANQQVFNCAGEQKNASVTIDFSTITVGNYEFSMRVTAADGTQKSVSVQVTNNMTKTQVRDAFWDKLNKAGFTSEKVAESDQLIIKWYAKFPNNFQLKKVEVFNFNQAGNDPKLIERTPGPDGTLPTYAPSP